MAMKGVLQGVDASGREIPGAAPSAAVTILAARLRPHLSPELSLIIEAMLRYYYQYPCPCPVNHNLDVDSLVVVEASVGKSITMKRFHTRGRGKSTRILKPFSRLRIVVREVQQEA